MMIKDNTKEKIYLDYLKAIAAILVVVDHTIGFAGEHYNYFSDWLSYIKLFTKCVHVPLFLLIAGYLCHKKPFMKYLKGKINRILIPFWFFTTLKILYSLLLSRDFLHGNGMIDSLFDGYIIGRTYWFSYAIFIMYLLSAIIIVNCKENRQALLFVGVFIILFVLNILIEVLGFSFPESISVFGYEINYPFYQVQSVLHYYPFFLLGLIIQKKELITENFLRKNSTLMTIVSAAGTLMVILSIVLFNIDKIGFGMKLFFSLPIMTFLYYMTKRLSNKPNVFSELGKYSYQIMLIDGGAREVLFIVCVKTIGIQAYTLFILMAVNVFLSFLICRIAKKTRFAKYILGVG